SKVAEASKQLRAICENSLREKPLGWFAENVEVMFVAIVIALGLRAYYLQPFRIPTGSMQPTLNGIIGTPMKSAEWPSLPVRLLEKVMRGRTYVKVENDRDRHIAVSSQGGLDIRDTQFLHFFSRSVIGFSDAPPLQLPAPSNPCMEIGLRDTLSNAMRNRGLIPKGAVIAEGIIDTGDLVLVDKFSYHFRKPKRGEVFVFDTIDNEGIRKRSGPQGAGSHYIKRLCGVPGDTLSIQSPHLLVDGKIAKEPWIDRVSRAEGVYSINSGYELAKVEPPQAGGKRLPQYLVKESDTLALAAKAPVGMREYAALGDNTGNSLDSRYWGPVKEFNLVGPALFSLWPFSTGHWGFIK
ncbi:MAG: signal peptidase I, partial [Verrucomicrobiaceae bacterium]